MCRRALQLRTVLFLFNIRRSTFRQFSVTSVLSVVAYLFSEEPENHGDRNAHQHHARNRDVDFEVGPVDDDIAGKPPQGDLYEPGPKQADGKNDEADDDEILLHMSTVCGFIIFCSRAAIPKRTSGGKTFFRSLQWL